MPNPFLALKSRYFVFGVFFVSSVVIGLLYTLLLLVPNLAWFQDDPIKDPITFILIFSSLCSILWLRGRRVGLQPRNLFGALLPRFSIIYLLLLVVSGWLFSYGSFLVVFYPVSLIAPQFVTSLLLEELLKVETMLPNFYHGLMIFVTVIYAPLTEEFIFRGILLQRWSVKWGLRAGIVLSSVLFGALHVNNPVGLTMFGLIMALLYVRSRSLWLPILAHSLNNLLSVLPELLSTGAESTSLSLADFQQTWWIGLIFLGLSAPVLGHFIYRSWPSLQNTPPYFANLHHHL
ncbi:MAG: CPBP family intramembrane glutamic endopeptidase [Cyanobacteria bacterium P01_A01_bin.114]